MRKRTNRISRRELIVAGLCDLAFIAIVLGIAFAFFATYAKADCVLVFTSQNCGPCQQLHPLLDKLRNEGVDIRTVDVDQRQDLRIAWHISRWPTLVYVSETQHGNYEVERATGALPEDRLRWFCRPRRLLYDVAPITNCVRSILGLPILVGY